MTDCRSEEEAGSKNEKLKRLGFTGERLKRLFPRPQHEWGVPPPVEEERGFIRLSVRPLEADGSATVADYYTSICFFLNALCSAESAAEQSVSGEHRCATALMNYGPCSSQTV